MAGTTLHNAKDHCTMILTKITRLQLLFIQLVPLSGPGNCGVSRYTMAGHGVYRYTMAGYHQYKPVALWLLVVYWICTLE